MENNEKNKRVYIYIRKKPLLGSNDEDICYVNSIHNLSIKVNKIRVNLEKQICFKDFYADYIFDENKTNDDLFNTIIKNKISKNIRNLIYFAYGQSGTGKTHTLLGVNGLIYKTCQNIIENEKTNILISSFQIYEDNIYDLYNNMKGKLYERNNSIFLFGIQENSINTMQKLFEILNINRFNRKQGTSSHNNQSSRSHAVYKLRYNINQVEYNIHFIDLAGTERACNANIVNIHKNSYINMSLLSLKECIRAYTNNSKHIPFRSNKLTLYLRNFFINKCHIMMLSLISAENKHLIDTLDTLKYTDYMNKISAKKIFQIKEEIKKDKLLINKPKKNLIKSTMILKNKISKINKKANIYDYISERNEIIKAEDNLFLCENSLDNTQKINEFHTNIVKLLNKKIDCIEKFCDHIKDKYKR